MNSADTTACMAVLSGAYPNLTVTDEMVLLWAEAFSTAPAYTVTGALRLWIETEEWPPTIAGIRGKMRERLAAQEREQSYTPREIPNARYLSFQEGRKVAAFAYASDCKKRGVEPSWDYWERAIGATKDGAATGKAGR